ncbi:MAG: hypothetical protein R3E58_01450 [Phycisphaerae bacterium]
MPDPPSGVHIDATHDDDFTGPQSGYSLNLDHGLDLLGKKGLYSINVFVLAPAGPVRSLLLTCVPYAALRLFGGRGKCWPERFHLKQPI